MIKIFLDFCQFLAKDLAFFSKNNVMINFCCKNIFQTEIFAIANVRIKYELESMIHVCILSDHKTSKFASTLIWHNATTYIHLLRCTQRPVLKSISSI
jgi:hypothetical protein